MGREPSPQVEVCSVAFTSLSISESEKPSQHPSGNPSSGEDMVVEPSAQSEVRHRYVCPKYLGIGNAFPEF